MSITDETNVVPQMYQFDLEEVSNDRFVINSHREAMKELLKEAKRHAAENRWSAVGILPGVGCAPCRMVYVRMKDGKLETALRIAKHNDD